MAQDRGAGLVSTAAGTLVFILFVVFAVQLLFSLYASSTVTAVAHDAAARAASDPQAPLTPIEADVRRQLGRMGAGAELSWRAEDSDGDGLADTIALRVVVVPPRLVPRSIGDGVGMGVVDRTARVRIEQPITGTAP
ncbi:MAG: hypothetical protein ACLGI8_07390 [Acidimicrobiia bacterium]|jgi:hypothetical protein